jgi:hypothetical protein
MQNQAGYQEDQEGLNEEFGPLFFMATGVSGKKSPPPQTLL